MATLALWLSLFTQLAPADPGLDLSWQAMLVHAHVEGLQFGRDIIFTWGPLGFLCSLAHIGSAGAVPILVWQVLGKLLMSLALVTLTRPVEPWRRIAFLAAVLAFHWLFQDTVFLVLIALIALSALMKPDARPVRLAAWTLVLGFLAQIKFTYFIDSSAAVLAAFACWSLQRSWKRAWAVAGGFALAVPAVWMASGQNLDNLYPYVRRSLEISSGYADAMGLDEAWPTFLWGAALAILCALFCWRAWRTVADRPFALGASGFLAFSFLVVWKESFIRADLIPLGGHVFGLFTYVLMLAPVVPGLLFPGRRWHWFDASIVLCLLGIACIDPDYYRLAPRVAWERVYGNVGALSNIGGIPGEWQRSFDEACARAALPRIRAAVGQGTVDVYDCNTGVALLNGLRLSSRPIFQSYSAYTPGLEGWNLRFYQSDRAPDFLLWSGTTIDNRYPGQDDAMLVAALPGHYEPVLSEGGYWLFRRRTALPKAALERRLVLKRTVHLSEEIELPLLAEQAVWLRASASPNSLGRLRSLLYKPALINIVTTDYAGRRGVWRLLPRVAQDGFILAPTLFGGGDLASLMHGDALTWVRSFHFEAPAGQEEFWSHVGVELSQMPGIPFNSPSPVGWLVELGLFDRPPVSITSEKTPEVIEVPEKALLLHAEGEIVFNVPAGAARFAGGFGIQRGAYSGDGHTRGVEFSVDGVWASGRRERLWGRHLDPVAEPRDRGTQRMDIALPPDPPAKLVLHTGAGPEHDNRWDWSYVSGLGFDAPVEK